MKRIAILVVGMLYLVSCLGLAANRFYCCGKLASVSLSLALSGKTESKHQKCCKTAKETLRIRDCHVAPQLVVSAPECLARLVLTAWTTGSPQSLISLRTGIGRVEAPPGRPVHIFTLSCNYRI